MEITPLNAPSPVRIPLTRSTGGLIFKNNCSFSTTSIVAVIPKKRALPEKGQILFDRKADAWNKQGTIQKINACETEDEARLLAKVYHQILVDWLIKNEAQTNKVAQCIIQAIFERARRQNKVSSALKDELVSLISNCSSTDIKNRFWLNVPYTYTDPWLEPHEQEDALKARLHFNPEDNRLAFELFTLKLSAHTYCHCPYRLLEDEPLYHLFNDPTEFDPHKYAIDTESLEDVRLVLEPLSQELECVTLFKHALTNAQSWMNAYQDLCSGSWDLELSDEGYDTEWEYADEE